jgi:hypothetical protein
MSPDSQPLGGTGSGTKIDTKHTENRPFLTWQPYLLAKTGVIVSESVHAYHLYRTKKENFAMFGTLGTILLIFSLALGGGGVTLAASQYSTPDQPLYPLKTWSEEVRLQITQKEQVQLQLALAFAERRALEMQAMLKQGEVPPEAIRARWQAEIERAFQLAAGQPDAAMLRALAQIREQLKQQEQVFNQLGPQAYGEAEAVLARVRTQLRLRLEQCEQGLKDPEQLREQIRLREELRLREQDGAMKTGSQPENSPGPGPKEGAGDGPGSNVEAGDNGYGPADGTGEGVGPGDGSGYGPGDGDGTCDGYCDGSNESYGPGPGDGTGDGPGDGTGSGTPGGNGSEPGGSGGSGGSGKGK